MKRSAQRSASLVGLRQISIATSQWTVDNGGNLPSPKYSGNEANLPDDWDYQGTGSGLWFDGVVYKAVYGDSSRIYSGETKAGHSSEPILKAAVRSTWHRETLPTATATVTL